MALLNVFNLEKNVVWKGDKREICQIYSGMIYKIHGSIMCLLIISRINGVQNESFWNNLIIIAMYWTVGRLYAYSDKRFVIVQIRKKWCFRICFTVYWIPCEPSFKLKMWRPLNRCPCLIFVLQDGILCY